MASSGHFATTQWSMVVEAAQRGSGDAELALADLCARYWSPIYVFIRRKGYSTTDAEDLTQEFLSALLEKNYLQSADPSRGRFRTFLLTAVTRFLMRQSDRNKAKKRGGGRRHLSLDFATVEGQYRHEPADESTPEALFERTWALTLLHTVLQRLAEDYAQKGKSQLFDALKSQLTGHDGSTESAQLVEMLRLTPGALKVALHRLRRRFGDLLRQEVMATVADADELEEELRSLFRAVGSTKSHGHVQA